MACESDLLLPVATGLFVASCLLSGIHLKSGGCHVLLQQTRDEHTRNRGSKLEVLDHGATTTNGAERRVSPAPEKPLSSGSHHSLRE